MNERLLTILEFIEEIEKFKHVYRVCTLSDGSRQESDAEHSWHLATIILLLKNELGIKFNVEKAIKIALVHDLVEIYTGDTWADGEKEKKEKQRREQESAKKLFSQLPQNLKKEIEGYWQDYENIKSKEARIVKGLDKIVYPMHYAMSGKIIWNGRYDSSEERRLYGLPHVKHNKILGEIWEYYNAKLDKIKQDKE